MAKAKSKTGPKKTTKKAVAKKPATAKKATAKRSKPIAQSKAKPKKSAIAARSSAMTRRPDPNLPPTPERVDAITNELLLLIAAIDDYTANLRSLDRQRHNGVGLKRQGFIEAALRLSTRFPQYFPHWLNTPKFKNDLALFNSVRSLVEVCRSLEEKAWNINIEASDMVYTDALEYYSQVKDAAGRRVDAAESIYNELFEFFRNMGQRENEDQPTQKQAKKDFNAVMKGKKEGKVGAENIKPKTTGGKREIIDETYKGSASFKESEAGSINE